MATELQKRLADARHRADQKRADGDASPTGKKAKPQRRKSRLDFGPPFYNRAYVVALANKNSDYLNKRLREEVWAKYNKDHSECLELPEAQNMVEYYYESLELPKPNKRLVKDLLEMTGCEGEKLDQDKFDAFYQEMFKKAMFKLKISGAETGFEEAKEERIAQEIREEMKNEEQPGVPRKLPPPETKSGAGAKAARREGNYSDCPDLPVGTAVIMRSFYRCHPDFLEGAKKLNLKNFVADKQRLPPSLGLTVIGAYQHKGAPRGSVEHGSYVVGICDDQGEEYLIDSRGLRLRDAGKEDSVGMNRAREERKKLSNDTAVWSVLQQFEKAGTLGGTWTASATAIA